MKYAKASVDGYKVVAVCESGQHRHILLVDFHV